MNDFACYDSLFSVGSVQSSELQQCVGQQNLIGNDLQSSTLYCNEQMDVPVQQLKQQQSSNQQIVNRDDMNLVVASALRKNSIATYSTPHKNIPFVQIHTTDVQPPRNSYGNVFRRTVSNHSEIKSEPIKSEAADSSKDRVNATPTPPVRNSSCNNNESTVPPLSSRNDAVLAVDENVATNVLPPDSSDSVYALESDISYNLVRKCNQCRFLCLEDSILEEHTIRVHSSSNFNDGTSDATKKQMLCPGCSNVFFSKKSFEIHLIEDHFVCEKDTKKILEALQSTVYNKKQFSTSLESNGIHKVDEPPTQERKSRIYLKNVECLREPRREPIEIDRIHLNHISDGFFQTNSFNNMERHMDLTAILNSDFCDVGGQINAEEKQESHQVSSSIAAVSSGSLLDNSLKQKISIKSVDVLREPALLQRDYNMQNQFCSLSNNCNDLNYDTFNGFQPSQNVVSSKSDLCPATNSNEHIDDAVSEKPRRPKIYIKNVDILKEPIMLPTFSSSVGLGMQDECSSLSYNYLAQSMQQSSTNSDFINNPSSLGVTNHAFNTNDVGQMGMGVGKLPDSCLYDSLTNGNNGTNNANGLLTDINGVGGSENFQSFGKNNGTVNISFLTYPVINSIGIDSSEHVASTTPLVTEPTPPPLPVFSRENAEGQLCNSMESVPLPTPPKQNQKIFIKNVDILKEPQFQEPRERGTLHLRTVDELNLMNRNEVENLIAPNLENSNMNSSSSSSFINHSEDPTHLPGEDDTAEQDVFYEETPLKLQDYASQIVNNWPADDYDLGDDIDCIITDSMETINNVQPTLPPFSPTAGNANLQKMIHELESPQISMISIRDIEELSGPQNLQEQSQVNNSSTMDVSNSDHTHRIPASLDSHVLQSDDAGVRSSLGILNFIENEIHKPCISSSLSESKDTYDTHKKYTPNKSSATNPTNIAISVATSASTTSFSFSLTGNLPPLTPVTSFSINSKSTLREKTVTSTSTSTVPIVSPIPVPPLVPVSSLVPFTVSNSATKAVPTTSTSTLSSENTTTTVSNATPIERGRIYIANNLMQEPPAHSNNDTAAVSAPKLNYLAVTGGTSVRGRPFGSNRSDNAKKTRSEIGEVMLKCTVRGCAFRFKKPDTLAYHKRCHDSNSSSLQAKLCPECKSSDFGNWNTLHTHLWRSHQIDMELYSCSQCPFKTPIYSRLVNTHTKIHSEERNYKCEQCEKAFKNTKQLKNHRRWHRAHNSTVSNSSTASNKTGVSNGLDSTSNVTKDTTLLTVDLHRCTNCGAAFSHLKSLREHSCKNSSSQLLCSVCGHVASSKSSLKLHMFTHENSKRLKCSSCIYSTSDHNAFRRHKMTHENTKMYVCPHCSYKSIQSVTFQKHVLIKHPDSASTLIHKCELCSYSTVNRTLFALHQIRHKPDTEQKSSSIELEDKTSSEESVPLSPGNKSPLDISDKNKNNNKTKERDFASTESL